MRKIDFAAGVEVALRQPVVPSHDRSTTRKIMKKNNRDSVEKGRGKTKTLKRKNMDYVQFPCPVCGLRGIAARYRPV